MVEDNKIEHVVPITQYDRPS